MPKRLVGEELRRYCDEFTGWELDDYELGRLVGWVEDHPAYRAMLEETPPLPADEEPVPEA